MKNYRPYVTCLFRAQVFETYYAYFLLSTGQLYTKETKEAANDFLKSYANLKRIDKRFGDPEFLQPGGDKANFRAFITEIKNWAKSDSVSIYSGAADYARVPLMLMSLKGKLLEVLGIKRYNLHWESGGVQFNSEAVKWKGHLPLRILDKAAPIAPLMENASKTESIVIVGDIRRSQELMTYTHSAELYTKRISEFMKETKKSVMKYGGIFDKFTGDGFVAYFNEEISRTLKKSYVSEALEFLKEELTFAKPFFERWRKDLRKQPLETIGLAIGADIGRVSFEHFDGHFVAVGESIVWATRMATSAKTDEVHLNNLLANKIRVPGVEELRWVNSETKTGESYRAVAITLEELKKIK